MRPDDKRRSCRCGHRYRDHGPEHGTTDVFGGKCLAWVDDPDATGLKLCTCSRWQPWLDDPIPKAGRLQLAQDIISRYRTG